MKKQDLINENNELKAKVHALECEKNKPQINIIGARWYDKINGNTYHTVKISIFNVETRQEMILKTENLVCGYDDHYLQTSCKLLKEANIINKELSEASTWKIFEALEATYKINYTITDGLKRDALNLIK